jgi:hypothetical protein
MESRRGGGLGIGIGEAPLPSLRRKRASVLSQVCARSEAGRGAMPGRLRRLSPTAQGNMRRIAMPWLSAAGWPTTLCERNAKTPAG